MASGFWATWYDVEDEDRGRYLPWLHDDYMPFIAQVPGFAWASHFRYAGGGPQMRNVKETVVSHTDDAIGRGSQFLILVGAHSAHDFLTAEIEAIAWPEGFAPMLALRRESRTAYFTLEAQIEGPAAGSFAEEAGPAPAIQMGTLRARSPEAELDLIRWYAQYRMPSMGKMTGSVRTRKLSGIAGWPKHGILYEFESLEMRLRHFEQTHESLALEPSHWTNRITRASWHAPGSPFIGEQTWPPVPQPHRDAASPS